jgi:hypothetical protein
MSALVRNSRENGMRVINHRLALLVAMMLFPIVVGSAKAQSGIVDLGKTLLGIQEEKPEIDYRPRPPLVIPPKKDLPPPAAPVTAKSQQWPNDPDVAALKKAEENRKKPVVMQDNNPRPLTIDEIRAGRVAGAGVPTQPESVTPKNYSAWIPPSELRALEDKFKLSNGPQIQPGIEPERQYLTDPPKGYRKAAAGAPLVTPKQTPVIEEDNGPLSFFRKRKKDDDD